MQILTTVHFLPVFLWLTSYYFYSPCPTEGAQRGDGSCVFQLKVLSEETGAVYFMGVRLHPSLTSLLCSCRVPTAFKVPVFSIPL